MDNFRGSNHVASWIHVRVSDLVYRTEETIFILLNIFMKLRRRLREKQTESHATWIEFSFEMRGTTKFVLQRSEKWKTKIAN